jgi:hypothetical protein
MEKMKMWRSVCVTDPSAVKAITGKQYKGNSPRPYWVIQRATETFGPCGIGWGVEVVSERFERFTDEALHVALVRVWYELDGKRGVIEQMGQTKAAYTSAAGKHIVDEDAPKKSVTDGMVKCLSMLGFAGDIFSGQWDDSAYVQWAAQETQRREQPVVSDKQAADIDALISEVGADRVAFLAWVAQMAGRDVKAVAEIPAAAVSKVVATLEKKRKPQKEAV